MRPLNTRRLLAALVACMTLSTACAGAAHAPADGRPIAPPALPADAGQLWLVNTRSLPHPAAPSSRRQLPEVLVLVNPHDRVLRWYRFLTPAGGVALGIHGLASPGNMGPQGRKLRQIDVGPLLKRQHGWSYYMESPKIVERLRHEAFLRVR